MTRDQAIMVLTLHKLRLEAAYSFTTFREHQIEMLKVLIADQEGQQSIEEAIHKYISYDDVKEPHP